ncbi:MAG TPA: glycoside hydrolase family 3 N-terminal domain-containing protein [Planctomycetota bacterium]
MNPHHGPLLVHLLALLAAPLAAQDEAQALLGKLSVEQKAGQLFVSWSLSRAEGDKAKNHERMLSWIRDAQLGGVILSLGTVEDAANLIPKLQAASQVPLLLAGDFEGGVWFRLTGACELGNQMLLGATQSASLAEQAGRITAREAKALGFHWVFAPVLDVNSNPQNPIINVRSFGEDPQLVARLGTAFARGVRSEGLIACGKHFPGHGDVDTDSHLALPTVPGDGAQLRARELLPFALAAKEGLESVMTGHLAVPGLGEDPAVPATMSRKILHEVLRGELGFTGLVVTDALDMGGVKGKLPPGEVAVKALLAGADVLLMPPDPLAARAEVVEAVKAGRVPMERLDDAVLRILRMKARVGLLAGGGRTAADWQQQMRTPEAEAVADTIAARGITLVRELGAELPLAKRRKSTAIVTVVDKDEGQGRVFADAMADLGKPEDRVRLSFASPREELERALRITSEVDRVVLALHVKVRSYSGGIGLPPLLHDALAFVRTGKGEKVVVSFGNPYLARDFPGGVYVAAYADTERIERAAARALRGQAPFLGRLPVGIPGVAAAGSGLSRYLGPADEIAKGTPSDLGLDPALPKQLSALLERAVADGAFPAAVCMVARQGVNVVQVAAGRLDYAADSWQVGAGTPFDLASLTKVCATTPAVLRLVADDKLSLDDPVQKWVPAFTGTGKDKVTIRHLLAHNGGLPAYERYYRTTKGRDAIVAAAAAEGLMTEPGTSVTYSDLGFVLLMAVVEKCSGEPFETFVQREVWQPLGMKNARFVPVTGAPLTAAAPTERDEQRGGVVHGFVHDENAFAMGGISGHAGMFATAPDVLAFGVAMLGGGRGVIPSDLVEPATTPTGIGGDTTRGLGFQLLQPGSWAGTKVPPGAFGHTGFTGTSLWCDPQHDLCVVLLTNRVHPTRVNNKILGVRRAVHDLVLGSLR